MARVSRQSARRFRIIPQVDIQSQGQVKGLDRQWGTEEKAGRSIAIGPQGFSGPTLLVGQRCHPNV